MQKAGRAQLLTADSDQTRFARLHPTVPTPLVPVKTAGIRSIQRKSTLKKVCAHWQTLSMKNVLLTQLAFQQGTRWDSSGIASEDLKQT
jgi:hypothetical protein